MLASYLQELFGLGGHRALVTGASSGLGRHFALSLAKAGAQVAVAARRSEPLDSLVKDIDALGCRGAVAVRMDVSDRASVCSALDLAARALNGPIDLLVNNAGVSDTKRALDYTDADWDAIVGTNLKGAWIVAQEAARRMVAAKTEGCIINISSILASRVAGGVTPYCASKAGLTQLTKSLALEFAHHGIRVNSLAPGYVETELNLDFLSSEAGDRLRGRIPAKRFGNVRDLDGPLLLLASRAGRFVNGAELTVDGGHLCSSL
jgi:NAD(P)-dependent dehydrogenase (short-subunit alcohol dehydrogenase family)